MATWLWQAWLREHFALVDIVRRWIGWWSIRLWQGFWNISCVIVVLILFINLVLVLPTVAAKLFNYPIRKRNRSWVPYQLRNFAIATPLIWLYESAVEQRRRELIANVALSRIDFLIHCIESVRGRIYWAFEVSAGVWVVLRWHYAVNVSHISYVQIVFHISIGLFASVSMLGILIVLVKVPVLFGREWPFLLLGAWMLTHRSIQKLVGLILIYEVFLSLTWSVWFTLYSLV